MSDKKKAEAGEKVPYDERILFFCPKCERTSVNLQAEKQKEIIDHQAAQIKAFREIVAEVRTQRDALAEQLKAKDDHCILPKHCPHGGEHKWICKCPNCGMKIIHNPDATIGSKALKKVED